MPSILGANTLSSGFSVDNSLRFNSADSAHLDLTDPPGNNYYGQFTFSFWVKRCKIGSEQFIVQSSAGNTTSFGGISFNSGDQLVVQLYDSTDNLQLSMITNRLFRDVSAWYHIMVAFDLNDGTTADRIKIYVNGTRETSFATSTIPGAGFGSAFFINATDPLYIGRGRNTSGSTVYSDFYLAQFLCVTADSGDTNGLNADAELIPTQVGEFDEDSPTIWKPIEIDTAVLGASLDMSDNLGTNGFFLDFKDSSNLGNDVNGGTDWDENNITATDQSTDTCTNNYATLNPIFDNIANLTYSEGNLNVVAADANYRSTVSTIGVSKGKWYAEFKAVSGFNSTDKAVGIYRSDTVFVATTGLGNFTTGFTFSYGATGNIRTNNGNNDTGEATFTDGDIIQVAMDLDNNKLYFGKNNTYINSGDPESGSTGTGAYSITASTGEVFYFAVASISSGGAALWSCNFGSPAYANSSDASDANGYGAFEFAPPSGYYALNTKNLAQYG